MVVSDRRVMVPGLCIDVINLDESRTWRRSGEVTSLKRLTREQPVTICEFGSQPSRRIDDCYRLSCIRVEVITSARLIACRRPYRVA